MRRTVLLILAATALLGAALLGTMTAEALTPEKGKAFLWDGNHWQQVSTEAKVSYIFGVGNLADFETAAGGARRVGYISRAFVDELKSKTVMQIVQEVDKYYQENPSKMSTSVIEVVLRRCTTACPPEEAAGKPKK